MEPSLPEFDDSWFLDLDGTRCSDIWPQDELLSGSKPDNDLHDGIFDFSPHRDLVFWRKAPDQDQQPVHDDSYALGDLFTKNRWEMDSMVPLGINHSKPPNGGTSDCFATDSFLSEQPAVESRSKEPAGALFSPSSPKTKTRKRRHLSDSTREKAKSVRQAGACLRCRIYKEPV